MKARAQYSLYSNRPEPKAWKGEFQGGGEEQAEQGDTNRQSDVPTYDADLISRIVQIFHSQDTILDAVIL